jgi:uncharacterized protein YggE
LITLGVEGTAPTPSAALSECTVAANAVLAAVRNYLPDPGAVQTTDLSVHPNWDQRGSRPQGYAARTTLTIRTRSVDDAGAIATDALEAAGAAGQVHGLSLIVDDTREATDDARASAFAEARRKAEHYAVLAGASLGDVLHINEGGNAELPHRFGAAAMLASAAAPPPIEPGESQITVVVSAVWALTSD